VNLEFDEISYLGNKSMSARLFLKRIMHGSFGNLTPDERVIVDSVQAALTPGEARVLSAQVAQIEIIQRSARGRMVLPFYSTTKAPEKLQVPEAEFCLARVYFTDDSHSGSVCVQTFNGHFRSLEFSRSPKDFLNLRVTAIDLRPKSNRSLPDAINRLQHGTNNAEPSSRASRH
jgi:hypothetical protein